MSIATLKKFTYEELRSWFKQQLEINMNQRKWAQSTVETYFSGAFYVWNKANPETFWEIVESSNFKEEAKEKIMVVVQKHCSGNHKSNTNDYYRAMEVFREFCISKTHEDKILNGDRTVKRNITNTKAKQNVVIPKPCIDEVNQYLKEWNDNEKFIEQEKVLIRLFKETYPLNDTIEGVLAKVTMLNVFYSTNILAVYPVVKHIVSKEIDEKLEQGDVSVVEDIRRTDRDNYSFATKYCSNHYPEIFPIYDSYVEKVLCYFRNCDNFIAFKTEELRQYKKFKEIIIAFRKYYGLEMYDLKKIDIYLWMVGKKHFAKN